MNKTVTKAAAVIMTLFIMIFTMTGCGSSSSSSTTTTTAASKTSSSSTDTSDRYSDRDCDATYDESTATKITLSKTKATVSGDGAKYSNGVITISDKGTYIISGILSDGQIIVDADDTDKVQIVLNGVSLTCKDAAPIYVRNADKVFITLAEGTTNTVSDSSAASYSQPDTDVTIDGAIFSTCDLTVNGSGNLTVKAGYKHGIVSQDDLKITGGNITVTATKAALRGNDSVMIKDGTLKLTSGTDAIHSKAVVYIDGGTLTISAGDDGMHADTDLTINGGTVNITKSYEGIEGSTVTINDGTISVVSSDDGINAAGGSDTTSTSTDDKFGGQSQPASSTAYVITINGGYVYVNASGDGIDSNGSIVFAGGTTVVAGPTENNNAPLDSGDGTGCTITVTGGLLLAVGSTGMLDLPESNDIYTTSLNASSGTQVTICDSDGKVVCTLKVPKTAAGLIFGGTDCSDYTIYTGGTYSGTLDANGFATGGTLSGGTKVSTGGTIGGAGSMGGGMMKR
jgi:hypothetical protein